jgi:GNAT superfamily N-acetyltransferase
MEPEDAREFLETHYASVHGIAAADYPAAVIDAWAPPVSEERVFAVVENEVNELRIVAESKGRIVGFGCLVVERGELRACYVSPCVARKGIGTMLVAELERLALDAGLGKLELVASVTAEPFYRSLGYSADGEVQHVLSGGVSMRAIAMHKDLNRAESRSLRRG